MAPDVGSMHCEGSKEQAVRTPVPLGIRDRRSAAGTDSRNSDRGGPRADRDRDAHPARSNPAVAGRSPRHDQRPKPCERSSVPVAHPRAQL